MYSILDIRNSSTGRFNFTGYVIDLPVFEYSNSELSDFYDTPQKQFLNLTRVRLSSSLNLWLNARIAAEYEIDGLYHNSNGISGFNSTGKTNRQLINLKWTPVDEKNFQLTHFIDRLYLRQDFKRGNIILGRQRIAMGTGRIWNPTDLFNPVNPASYFKIEKDGADAVSGKFAFGNFTDFLAVFNPQEKIRNSNYGFRFRTNYSGYDLSLMGGYFDDRIIIGGDFAGSVLNAGVRGEGIISVDKSNSKDRFIKFILGIDNQFTPKVYALAEYHYNGEGKTERSEYDFSRLENGEIQNLSRNYLCLSSSYLVNPLVNITLSDITNFNDGSGFINFLTSFSAKDNLTFKSWFAIYLRKQKSEYWYYPFSLYFRENIIFN